MKCFLFRVATETMVRLLINYGADVDEVNAMRGSSPLHHVGDSQNAEAIRFVTQLLLDAGAHTDYIDRCESLPGEGCEMGVRELIRANQKYSLKCRCAHLINAHKVSYRNHLPESLIAFVGRHGTSYEPKPKDPIEYQTFSIW